VYLGVPLVLPGRSGSEQRAVGKRQAGKGGVGRGPSADLVDPRERGRLCLGPHQEALQVLGVQPCSLGREQGQGLEL